MSRIMTGRRFSQLAAASLALAAAPVAAEPRNSDDLAVYYYQPVQICADARKAEGLQLTDHEQICSHARAMLAGKLEDAETGPETAYEANFYWHARASLEAQLQGIYRQMDGALSSRVCDQVRAQASAIDRIDPAAWPDEYAPTIEDLHESVSGPLERCRTAFP